MPSVTDVPQQSSNIHGKSTPPPPSSTSNSNDPNQFDAMLQSVQVFEKKLRNLVKRKVCFENISNFSDENECFII